eukprot:GHVN01048982.1.p1 GENE.GHVN01048982.1~~GHVN01048982.1.p1  ORF type:complete len:406 (+),score=50.99 GHVN01048982.1:93-1310(+)
MATENESDSPPLAQPEAEIDANFEEDVEDFDSPQLGLDQDLLRGIYNYGFEKPSAIQKRGILPILEGHDTIGQAQSGTGKTATFAISAIQKTDKNMQACQSLILVPTRELAQQIQNVVLAIGEYMGVRCHASFGGTAVRTDIAELKTGPHIVVGTPGRVKDMLSKGVLNVDRTRLFIVDEADEMLARGFRDQIYEVFQYLSNNIQVALFSATMPPEILELSEKFMRSPKKILVKKEELTLEGIRQFYIQCEEERHKFPCLTELYNNLSMNQTIIYCNTKRRVEELRDQLQANDFAVSAIHGEMEQSDREDVINQFRLGRTRVLVTTDLLARGIDVQQVSIVINYDMPRSDENYLHRIGRSGRFGRKGTAINFCTNQDIEDMKRIERFYNTQIEEMPANIETILSH